MAGDTMLEGSCSSVIANGAYESFIRNAQCGSTIQQIFLPFEGHTTNPA